MPRKNIKDPAQLQKIIQRRQAKKPNFNLNKFLTRHAGDKVFQNPSFAPKPGSSKSDIYNMISRNPGLSKIMGAPSPTGDFSSFLKQGQQQSPVSKYPKGIGGGAPAGSWMKGVATSFWDTGHSGMGDTGKPASGSPMQFHMVASPYLPMGTRLKLKVGDRTVDAFVGDKGPGAGGNLIDLSAPMAAYLYGRSVHQARTSTRDPIKYQITGWGKGSALYGGHSQAKKYAAKYGGLKKFGSPKGYVRWDKNIPSYYYDWRG